MDGRGVLRFFSVLYSKKVNKISIEGGVPKKIIKYVLVAPCCSLGSGDALPTGRT